MSTLLEIFKTMEYGPAPESPSAVNAWLDEHNRKFGLFINNEWVTPKGAKYYASHDPSNGELLAETVQAGQKEVDAAVAAARTAFESWSKTPGVNRAALHVRDSAQRSETSSLASSVGVDGQWQANPRVA